jgi:nicotine blue oxidoreductase
MGQPKAQIEINGERLVDRAVRIFKEAGIDHVYVVLGAWVGEVPGAHVLINDEWEEGMGSSLRCGLGALLELKQRSSRRELHEEVGLKERELNEGNNDEPDEPDEPDELDEVIVSLVDLPGLTPAAITRIANAPGELVMGTYGGKKGHPVKFNHKHWAGIIESARGDVGARNYLANNELLTLISLDDVASGNDLDTPEQLDNFKN